MAINTEILRLNQSKQYRDTLWAKSLCELLRHKKSGAVYYLFSADYIAVTFTTETLEARKLSLFCFAPRRLTEPLFTNQNPTITTTYN